MTGLTEADRKLLVDEQPADADRAMVAKEIERSRTLAQEADAAGDVASALYAGGIADMLEVADTADGVKFIRERALRALTGRTGVDIPGVPSIRPQERWLATWWLTHRTCKAREALNRERVKLGLPPVVRNTMAVADDW